MRHSGNESHFSWRIYASPGLSELIIPIFDKSKLERWCWISVYDGEWFSPLKRRWYFPLLQCQADVFITLRFKFQERPHRCVYSYILTHNSIKSLLSYTLELWTCLLKVKSAIGLSWFGPLQSWYNSPTRYCLSDMGTPRITGVFFITQWGRVTHICVSKLNTIGSNNGLSPGRCQAIIWTDAGIWLNGPLGTNLTESKLINFHSRKSILKCRLENGGHLVSASMRYQWIRTTVGH